MVIVTYELTTTLESDTSLWNSSAILLRHFIVIKSLPYRESIPMNGKLNDKQMREQPLDMATVWYKLLSKFFSPSSKFQESWSGMNSSAMVYHNNQGEEMKGKEQDEDTKY